MDPEIPIDVKDDEWLVKPFRMRTMRSGVSLPPGVVLTEDNLDEYTEPYNLVGKKITFTVRPVKPSSSFVPVVLDSDVDGLIIIDAADGLWKLSVDKTILARLVGVPNLFYSVVITESNIPDRVWSGSFSVSRR